MYMPGGAGGGGGAGCAVDVGKRRGDKGVVHALPIGTERGIEENRGEMLDGCQSINAATVRRSTGAGMVH